MDDRIKDVINNMIDPLPDEIMEWINDYEAPIDRFFCLGIYNGWKTSRIKTLEEVRKEMLITIESPITVLDRLLNEEKLVK